MTEKVLRRGRERILYDPQTLGEEPDSRWFDPAYWRAADAWIGAAKGRGSVQFVSHNGDAWALRHFHRGGLIGRLISDRYLYSGAERVRSFAEWRLLRKLVALELPAPEPVAARYSRFGPWYRADLITRRIEHESTLADALAGLMPPGPDRWRRIGESIRRFHDRGVCHADLNAHNILLVREVEYLIDFDRGSIRADGNWKSANLKRLLRSVRKLSAGRDPHWLDPAWESLMQGYGDSGVC